MVVCGDSRGMATVWASATDVVGQEVRVEGLRSALRVVVRLNHASPSTTWYKGQIRQDKNRNARKDVLSSAMLKDKGVDATSVIPPSLEGTQIADRAISVRIFEIPNDGLKRKRLKNRDGRPPRHTGHRFGASHRTAPRRRGLKRWPWTERKSRVVAASSRASPHSRRSSTARPIRVYRGTPTTRTRTALSTARSNAVGAHRRRATTPPVRPTNWVDKTSPPDRSHVA